MFKILFALFILPAAGLVLLVGVLIESAQAQAAPVSAGSGRPATMLRSDFRLAASAPASEGGGRGGPYEPVEAAPPESDTGRWRLVEDARAERRFAPPSPPPLTQATRRF